METEEEKRDMYRDKGRKVIQEDGESMEDGWRPRKVGLNCGTWGIEYRALKMDLNMGTKESLTAEMSQIEIFVTLKSLGKDTPIIGMGRR